jgi:hypothetical protein
MQPRQDRRRHGQHIGVGHEGSGRGENFLRSDPRILRTSRTHLPWLQDSARGSANPPALTKKSLQYAANLPALTRMSESRATFPERRQEILNGCARFAAPRGECEAGAGVLGGVAQERW